jgi:hypothetical protein
MLRELVEAMDALTAEQLLGLVLEHRHWSDVSTLNWLAYVTGRCTSEVFYPLEMQKTR